jgi:hypothetical protein
VRIWREWNDGENGTLGRRGSIEHVGTKKRVFFRNLEKILDFIAGQTGGQVRTLDP